MTTYTVLAPPAESKIPLEAGAEFIPGSKAFWALAMPLPWLLWHRLWWASLFYVLILTIFTLALSTKFALLVLVMTAIPGLFLFLEGNDLRQKSLIRQGWQAVGIVEGENLDSAEARYFYSRPVSEVSGTRLSRGDFVALQPTDTGFEFLASPEGR